MKIAIPMFNNRVSPRFDFASKILIATIDHGKVGDKKEYSLINLNPIRRSILLNEQGVNVLICGGVSCFSKRLLMSKGIGVIPMVQGEIEEVLTLFINDKVNSAIVPIIQGKRGKCKGRK